MGDVFDIISYVYNDGCSIASITVLEESPDHDL